MEVVIANKAVSIGRRSYKAGDQIVTNPLFAGILRDKGLVAGAEYERRDMQASDLSFLRNEYQTKFGRKADARWGVKRLTAELAKD